MSDIEKWISQLPTPTPSRALDQRVAAAIAGVVDNNERVFENRAGLGWHALVGCAMCAGALGFVLGRSSIDSPQPDTKTANATNLTDAEARSSNRAEPQDVSLESTSVANDDEETKKRLKQFLLAESQYESLWGNANLTGNSTAFQGSE